MAEPDPRPLSARLDAYIANLLSIADQLAMVRVQATMVPGVLQSSLDELDSTVHLYRTIAEDLTKVLNGEKLQEFRIEGELGG